MGMTARPRRRRTSGSSGGVRLIVASTLVASVLSAPGSGEKPDATGDPDASSNVSPLDVLASDGAPLAKRLGPIVGLAVAVLWLVRRRWR